eukprot:1600576-Rhodomonas_salina.1
MSDLAITIFQFSLQISDLNSRNFRRSSDLAGEFPPPNPNHRPLVTCYSRFQAVAQAQTAGPMAKYANVEPSSYAVRHFPHQSPRSLHVVCHFQAVWKSELEAPECACVEGAARRPDPALPQRAGGPDARQERLACPGPQFSQGQQFRANESGSRVQGPGSRVQGPGSR